MFVVAGESLVDLVDSGRGPDGARQFTAHPGGSPFNCAIALGRLGIATGLVCPISTDSFGDALLGQLAAAGVSSLIAKRVDAPTSLAVATLDAVGTASYRFYRAADRAFSPATLGAALPDDVELFQIGGFCAVEPEDAAQWLGLAEEAARRGATISIDPNVRLSLVSDTTGYRQRLSRFFDLANIVKLSDEDLLALDPTLGIEQHVASLLARPACRLVVVTLGASGSRAFTRSTDAQMGAFTPPAFGDTVGAGDSLMAGILAWLGEHGALHPTHLDAMTTTDLTAMLRFGAVAAGLNCAEHGCRPPTRAEIDRALLSGWSAPIALERHSSEA